MRRLRQGIVAVTLAVTMLLTGTAQPAWADDGPADNVVDLGVLAWNVYRAGAITPEQAVLFVRLLMSAISDTENAVIGHIDGLEAADVMGDLHAVTIALADYNILRQNEFWLELYVTQTGADYAGNAYEKYYRVSNRKAKDQIGLAGQSLYATLLTLATDAGLPDTKAMAQTDYRKLMNDIVKDLDPTCFSITLPDTNPAQYLHRCEAANGEKSTRFADVKDLSPADLYDLKAEAAKNSAWLKARRTLDRLGL